MSGWLMGVVGVIALATLADILLPEGETAKYIKGFLAIFVVAAIVAPIPFLLNSSESFGDIFDNSSITADEELLEKLQDMQEEEKEDGFACITQISANIYIIENGTLS